MVELPCNDLCELKQIDSGMAVQNSACKHAQATASMVFYSTGDAAALCKQIAAVNKGFDFISHVFAHSSAVVPACTDCS